MPYEVSKCACFGEVIAEKPIKVLASMIRVKSLDLSALLCLHHGFICCVGIKSFILGTMQVEVSESAMIISEGNIVLSSAHQTMYIVPQW